MPSGLVTIAVDAVQPRVIAELWCAALGGQSWTVREQAEQWTVVQGRVDRQVPA